MRLYIQTSPLHCRDHGKAQEASECPGAVPCPQLTRRVPDCVSSDIDAGILGATYKKIDMGFPEMGIPKMDQNGSKWIKTDGL